MENVHILYSNNQKTDKICSNDQNGRSRYENLINYIMCKNTDISSITSLNLSGCSLSEVPTTLRNLPLKDLNLSNNNINEIPQCLYLGLNNLEQLDLSNNKISLFEFEPCCHEKLKTLNLSRNLLKDIPQWIMNLRAPNLEKLIYDLNKITYLRCIFNNNSKFSVRKMSLRNCILRQEDCKFLKECSNFEELDLSNKFTEYNNRINNIDEIFDQPNWRNISILKLNNLGLSLFPEGITWLETLTELYLSFNDLMWLPKDGLEYLVNLEILDLSHNSLYSIPDKLTWLLYVKELRLSYNKLESVPDFSKMKTLETLDLFDNKLLSYDFYMENTNLKYADLEYNYFNTDEFGMEGYKDMKDRFRKILEEPRGDGSKAFGTISEYTSTVSDDEEISEEEFATSVLSEDWDEEIKLCSKQEDVSPSDDEWQGFEIISNTSKKVPVPNSKFPLLYNEDVIFCDAD